MDVCVSECFVVRMIDSVSIDTIDGCVSEREIEGTYVMYQCSPSLSRTHHVSTATSTAYLDAVRFLHSPTLLMFPSHLSYPRLPPSIRSYHAVLRQRSREHPQQH